MASNHLDHSRFSKHRTCLAAHNPARAPQRGQGAPKRRPEQNRQSVSATFIQPFIGYTTKKAATFTINSESTYDWKHDQWTIPVNFMVAQLFPPKLTGLPFPIQLQVGYRHYFSQSAIGPEDRFSIIALFPK
jgi:hypothetical protein